jgi:transcriptional regulator with GAF, ATPase, and Fis domain
MTGVLPIAEAALTAGRSPDNDLDAGIRLAVNGKRVDPAFLRPGDRLEVGRLILILDHASEASSKEAAPEAADRRGVPLQSGLAKLCALVAEERDMNVLMQNLMNLLLEAFGGDDAFLFSLDTAGRPDAFVSSRGGDAERLFSDTVVTEALKGRKGLVIGNALADPAFARSKSISDLRLHSVLCCPIMVAGRSSGLIYLGSNRPAVSFDQNHLRELEVYALVAGGLINHVAYIARQRKVLESLRPSGKSVGMVAFCASMQAMLDELRAVAAGDISVLLQGETGTGKDVAANAIHRMSRRAAKPFLVVNCGTLRGELLASELFGHRKGAFTGAVADQKGLFPSADGGTLFLDEIGEMDLSLQAMLLRVLESGKVRPVGQAAEVTVDVRIVCATNRDLADMVAKGSFRQDLYYRVNQHMVRLPPLRDRGEDIIILAHHFLEKARAAYPEKRIEGFHPDSLAAMAAYGWPGNLRELANAVQKAVLFARSPLLEVALPIAAGMANAPTAAGSAHSLDDATRGFQYEFIRKTMAKCGGDRDKAAAMLGISRSTFFRHLAQSKSGEDGRGE